MRSVRLLFVTACTVYAYYLLQHAQCTLTNYLLTYDSYVPLYNRFHRGEWITRVSGGEGALDTPGPLNGMNEPVK
jgi:hypothetical protein